VAVMRGIQHRKFSWMETLVENRLSVLSFSSQTARSVINVHISSGLKSLGFNFNLIVIFSLGWSHQLETLSGCPHDGALQPMNFSALAAGDEGIYDPSGPHYWHTQPKNKMTTRSS
jgi:hypothetical protein